MCGIAGYIGKAKKPKVTHDLTTRIFARLESRGTDAAGIWGLESKEKPKVIYHKAPIKSSEFMQIPIWAKVQNLNPNLLLVHARRTSPGVGHARNNENNHPFVSEDKRIGVIHNGKIHEASFLTDKYETQTDCDSEILLRMYENAIVEPPLLIPNTPQYMQERLASVHEFWSVVRQGSCAAMIGELHVDGSRTLMLFRNKKRPLWVADLRETLGQVFFFSETEIWHQAVSECNFSKEIGTQKLAELPVNEVWGFKIDQENQIVTDSNFHRVAIKTDKSVSKDWTASGKKRPIQPKKINLSIVTDLDAKGNAPNQVPAKTVYAPPSSSTFFHPDIGYQVSGPWAHDWKDRWGHFDRQVSQSKASNVIQETLDVDEDDDTTVDDDKLWMEEHTRDGFENEQNFKEAADEVAARCEEIKRLVDQIETNFVNAGLEGSITSDDFQELLTSLEQTQQDLEGTVHFLPKF